MSAVAIFDIDGTLVDTNYHHALAWYRAFRSKGVVMPIWRIHRAIGIGSDRVVALLAGDEVEGRFGEALRVAEGAEYQEMIDEVEPMEGAHELLEELKQAGHTIILASSAEQKDAELYIDLLDAKEFVDAYTTSADVAATKPEPDIVNAAIQKAGGGTAVMIGDSAWDCKAATAASVPSIGVLTGGFSEQELTEAGASIVFDSVDHLRSHLHSTSLRGTVEKNRKTRDACAQRTLALPVDIPAYVFGECAPTQARHRGSMYEPHPNTQLIRGFHDCQNRFYAGGDQEPVRAMLTENVVWHVPGASAITGDYHGRDEVLRYFARRRELADATFRINVRGVLADNERTVILAGGEVEHDGETFAWGTVGIFRIVESRIAECWVVPYDQSAFDEIWSKLGRRDMSDDGEGGQD